MSTFLGFVALFGLAGWVVWQWVRGNRTQHVCQRIVVEDGTVDMCRWCGKAVFR